VRSVYSSAAARFGLASAAGRRLERFGPAAIGLTTAFWQGFGKAPFLVWCRTTRIQSVICSIIRCTDTPMARPISGGITAAPSADAAAWNPIKRSATAADLRSAVVRTSSGYIGAVDNPNNSTAVVAVKARPNRDSTATIAPRRSATRGHDRLTDCGAGRRSSGTRCRPAAC
jgi:hypothetical protein